MEKQKQKVLLKGNLIKKAHEDDAAYDLVSNDKFYLAPNDRFLVKTGTFIALPVGFEAQVRPRSGMALKYGITVLNSPGTIDAGYRGEIGVILINHGKEARWIQKGDRIAQLVINELKPTYFEVVEDFIIETKRNDGGFGHTGR